MKIIRVINIIIINTQMSNNVMSLIKQVGEMFAITASSRNKLKTSKVAILVTIMESTEVLLKLLT